MRVYSMSKVKGIGYDWKGENHSSQGMHGIAREVTDLAEKQWVC